MASAVEHEIAEVERQIIAVRLKTEEKVLVEQERLAGVVRRRQELVEAHEARLREAAAEHLQQLQSVESRAAQEIEQAVDVREEAEERGCSANVQAEALEERARRLEKEIDRMSGVLHGTLLDHEHRYDEIRMSSDVRVLARQEETDRIVRDASLYASEIQDDGLLAIQEMHDSSRALAQDAEKGSKERSKFRELCNLLASKQEIPTDQFHDAKLRVYQEWLDLWMDATSAENTSVLSPRSSTAQDALTPSSPDRPRSVERARARAEQLRQGCGSRPVTAP